MSELHQMQESETIHFSDYEILRVPGGWIYTRFSAAGIGSCFVPHNEEFADTPIESIETSALVDEWNLLDPEQRLFVLRVRDCAGQPHLCEPLSSSDGDISLWDAPQDLGLIECTGKCIWHVTPKFRSLEFELMGCKE